jgi:hypothetical protein
VVDDSRTNPDQSRPIPDSDLTAYVTTLCGFT